MTTCSLKHSKRGFIIFINRKLCPDLFALSWCQQLLWVGWDYHWKELFFFSKFYKIGRVIQPQGKTSFSPFSLWSSSQMTPVAQQAAWMGPATPHPSASHWVAPPQGLAPPHLESAVSSLFHAGAQAVRTTPTSPWHPTQSALTQTPAPTQSANQTLTFASSG